MNITIITGRLTATPELKTTPNGKMVTSFSVANDTGWGDNKKTNFLNCVAWNKTAENICKFFSKGDPILINGEINTRSYEAKDGAKRTATEILVNGFDFFAGKKAEGNTAEAATGYDVQPHFEDVNTDEGLPF